MAETAPQTPPPVAKSRRRWFQLSLRTLFIFMTVVGCLGGLFGRKLKQARDQREVVDRIVHWNGIVCYSFPASTPDWLVKLLRDDFFGNVDEIIIHGGNDLTDEKLEFLEKFPQLRRLSIGSSQITDAGLARVKRLKQLTELDLTHSLADLDKALPRVTYRRYE